MKLTNRMREKGELASRDLTGKAREFYNGTDPLEIYEDDREPEEKRYFVRGCIEADSLTFEELQQLFADLQEQAEEA